MVLDDYFFTAMLFLFILMLVVDAYTWLRGRSHRDGMRSA
jgi:hypothetical protein